MNKTLTLKYKAGRQGSNPVMKDLSIRRAQVSLLFLQKLELIDTFHQFAVLACSLPALEEILVMYTLF